MNRLSLRTAQLALALALAPLLATPAASQAPAAKPAFKGVWEPASFSEDIELETVFFDA